MEARDCILFSGGAQGAEAAFGACAERHGIEEVNFTFEGHTIARHRGVRVLNHEELQKGDVSLAYVSRFAPLITHTHFTGTGTRTLKANGQRAIEKLLNHSFGA